MPFEEQKVKVMSFDFKEECIEDEFEGQEAKDLPETQENKYKITKAINKKNILNTPTL